MKTKMKVCMYCAGETKDYQHTIFYQECEKCGVVFGLIKNNIRDPDTLSVYYIKFERKTDTHHYILLLYPVLERTVISSLQIPKNVECLQFDHLWKNVTPDNVMDKIKTAMVFS